MTLSELEAPPGPVLLARALAGLGVPFVVVGSTAGWLRDGGDRPRDLDVVIEPAVADDLLSALRELGVPGVPPRLRAPDPQTLLTGWCPLDVFRGRPPA